MSQSGGRLSTWTVPGPTETLSRCQEPSLPVCKTVELLWYGVTTTRTLGRAPPSELEIVPLTFPTNGPFALLALQAATMATMASTNGMLRFMGAKVCPCALLVH